MLLSMREPQVGGGCMDFYEAVPRLTFAARKGSHTLSMSPRYYQPIVLIALAGTGVAMISLFFLGCVWCSRRCCYGGKKRYSAVEPDVRRGFDVFLDPTPSPKSNLVTTMPGGYGSARVGETKDESIVATAHRGKSCWSVSCCVSCFVAMLLVVAALAAASFLMATSNSEMNRTINTLHGSLTDIGGVMANISHTAVNINQTCTKLVREAADLAADSSCLASPACSIVSSQLDKFAAAFAPTGEAASLLGGLDATLVPPVELTTTLSANIMLWNDYRMAGVFGFFAVVTLVCSANLIWYFAVYNQQQQGKCGTLCCFLAGCLAVPLGWIALFLGWTLASAHLACGTVLADLCAAGGVGSALDLNRDYKGEAGDTLRYFLECPSSTGPFAAPLKQVLADIPGQTELHAMLGATRGAGASATEIVEAIVLLLIPVLTSQLQTLQALTKCSEGAASIPAAVTAIQEAVCIAQSSPIDPMSTPDGLFYACVAFATLATVLFITQLLVACAH
eukprot:SAG31_NODE_3153_length_4614_cov_6.385604_2_plen_507_part_00